MSSFKEYLDKIQELTDKNLQILSLLNESFYSRKTSTSAIVGDTTYTIPSFIILENKINDLEGNWNRLISAPDAGNARFVLDGNSRKILLSGYETAPASLSTLKPDTYFAVEPNDVFKDFISPNIYLKFNLDELPANIKKVNVRKVSIKNSNISLTPGNTTWVDFWPSIEGYTDQIDYTLYDRVYELPLYVNDYDGEFTVTDIDTYQDGKNVYWDVELDKYTYIYDSGTLNGDIIVGDTLISKDGECKFLVTSCDYNTSTFTLLVTSGYAQPQKGMNLRYFKALKSTERYVKVPLEEDQQIAIFIAPINDDVHTSAAWSGGVVINTDDLKDENGNKFSEVYDSKIKNLGDILNDITQFVGGSLSSLSDIEVNKILDYVPPTLTEGETGGNYTVTMLNDHLLDNASVEQIRKLNNEKANISADLVTIQDQIDEVTSILMSTDLSIENASVRTEYENRLKSLNSSSTSKTQDYISKINEISTLAGSAVLPTSGAKYTIRGAIDTAAIKKELGVSGVDIIRVEILYRYKNINKNASNATTVSDVITVSDWNKYIIDYRQKLGSWKDGAMTYEFEPEASGSEDVMAPQWRSFNIPITQGETVDIRYRVQYDLGYPYVSTFSQFSEVVNVGFPDDLIQYADIETIISNNKADARDSTVAQALISGGVTDHVNDKVIDQDLTYYHRPESISSGFYTEDSRRIISLKDKLYSLNSDVEQMKINVFGGIASNLVVTIYDTSNSVMVTPNVSGAVLYTKNYQDIVKDSSGTVVNNEMIYTTYIDITNTSSTYPISLYSMYYGDPGIALKGSTKPSRFSEFKDEYCDGVKFILIGNDVAGIKTDDTSTSLQAQRLSQLLYFRNVNRWTGEDDPIDHYTYGAIQDYNGFFFVNVNSFSDIQLLDATPGSYVAIDPGDTITIPMVIKMQEITGVSEGTVFHTHCAFDLWTSPFSDPITYDFAIEMRYASGISRKTNNIGTRRLAVTPRARLFTIS